MTETQSAAPKLPVVDRVMYGVGKFVERHTPTAHADRIIHVINRFVIPKLKPEQLKWVGRHKDAIETAAVVAGVGITATEITLATVFTVRLVKHFRGALERIKANRPQPMQERAAKPHTTLQEVARGKPKGPHVEYGKKQPPVVYDRTKELLLIQEMADAGPMWETPVSRALAEGKLVLRDNERVDWKRLGLPDPAEAVKKQRKVKLKHLKPSVPSVNSYAYKATPTPESVAPAQRGLGDVIRDKIEEIWPWSFQNTELRLRRQKFAAQRALKEQRVVDAAKKAAELEEKARLRLHGPMTPADPAKMKELSAQYEDTVAAIRERVQKLAKEADERDVLRRAAKK